MIASPPALAEFPVRFTPFHHVARYFRGAVVNYSPVVEFDGEISAVFRIDIVHMRCLLRGSTNSTLIATGYCASGRGGEIFHLRTGHLLIPKTAQCDR